MLSLDSLSSMDWHEYFQHIMNDASTERNKWLRDTLEKRLGALEKGGEILRGDLNFSDIDEHWRSRIAGYKDFLGEIEWHWFGVTRGTFTSVVKADEPHRMEQLKELSDALKCIPPEGTVTKKQFRCFVDSFRFVCHPDAKDPNPIGTATRLLTYKRPDYFVPFNGASKDKLCKTFSVPKGLRLYDYWDRVIEPILRMNWQNLVQIEDNLEKRIWQHRVAILDVSFYHSKSEHVARYSR